MTRGLSFPAWACRHWGQVGGRVTVDLKAEGVCWKWGSLYYVITLCFLLQSFAPPILIGQLYMMAKMISQLVPAEFSLKGVRSLTY